MLAKIAVADFMSTNIVSVSPDMEVSQAIKKLLDHKITSLPVLDERGKLVGVFSEKDGLKVVLESAYNQRMEGKVSEMMTKEPPTIEADESLVDAALKFQDKQTRSFPVFKNGQMVGMISWIDVLRALLPMR